MSTAADLPATIATIVKGPVRTSGLRSIGAAILLAVVALGAASARDLERPTSRSAARTEGQPAALGTYRSLSLRPSHDGLFQAAVVDVVGDSHGGAGSAWTVSVTDSRGAPVGDARIDVILWMPEGGDRDGIVLRGGSHRGDGEYVVGGMAFPRGGWWNVALRISAGIGTDSLAFNLVLPAAPDLGSPGTVR
jgi:hypothetical protein